MAQDYWWVTRPKRKLNAIPEVLAAFCSSAQGKPWTGHRENHIAFENELENSGTKRVGERRDASGSGGRTHAAMLYSLGLWFEKNDKVFLTLAGEAIMQGKSPVPILKNQVLRFQYPSPYGDTVKISSRFKVRPFIFLLKLLHNGQLEYLTQEEIAFIIAIQAENETPACYKKVTDEIFRYRTLGDAVFPDDYLASHQASKENLMDIANTLMNWLDFTQLVYREKKRISIDEARRAEISEYLCDIPKFIRYPVERDVFQRKYGVDPWHQKDTRNLLQTPTITSQMIDKNRILKAFFAQSSLKPIARIDAAVVAQISEIAGTAPRFTEQILQQTYPHGAIGGYLSSYRDMAFKGRDEAADFEKATANLFQDIFGYQAIHLGQTGSKPAPDVLLISDSDGYQAIIDNKAYSSYSITGDHHNRMVHNYLQGIGRYSSSGLPIGFFTYIAGGFASHIDSQILSEVTESGIHGSGITVSNLISLIENHQERPYSHRELRDLFGLDRQILLSDLGR